MKTVRIFILTAAMSVGIPYGVSQSVAQSSPSPEALQAAKELVSVISGSMISEVTSSMTAQVWPSMEASLLAQHPKLDPPTLVELRNEFERLQVNNVSEFMNDAPAIYARHFTAQEMRDIAAFYRTPTGDKTLKVMPQAMAELYATMSPRLQGLQERVNLAFLNILQRRGYYGK
jgi:hypothetical protein